MRKKTLLWLIPLLLVFCAFVAEIGGVSVFGGRTSADTSMTRATLWLPKYANDRFGELYVDSMGVVHVGDKILVTPQMFGLPADTSIDATAYEQAAINFLSGVRETYDEETGDVTLDSVAAPRAGAIYHPARRYKIARGLVKNVTHPTLGTRWVNSQLYIPLVVRLDSSNRRMPTQILFLGEAPPTYMVNYLNPLFWAQPDNAAVLHSTINNDGSLYPAVIRAVPDSLLFLGSYLSNNLTEWHMENMVVRVHHDTANGGTQLCGVDFHNTPNHSMRNFRVECDVDNYYTVAPGHEVFAVRSGVWGSGNTQVFENGVSTGAFTWGAMGYEHSIFRNVVSLCNYYAFGSATANYPMVLDHCGAFGNKHVLHAGKFQISGVAGENAISANVRVEKTAIGKWYDADGSYDIVDSLNKLRGTLEYWVTNGSPQDTIRVKGGANLQVEYKSSITSGTAIIKYPNNLRYNFGGTQFNLLFNGNGATPALNSRFSLTGNALGMDVYMRNSDPAGFTNIQMENDRASGVTQALIQLGGSAEVQGALFGRSRRDVMLIASGGPNARGMSIGSLTADSVVVGTASNPFAFLLPAGNWQFSPPNTFLIYNRTNTTYNVGIGTTTPLQFLGQTMTDRRVVNITDSTYFAGYYAQGQTGAAMTLGHIGASLNQKYFQMFCNAGLVSLLAVADNGGSVPFNIQTWSLANGTTHFGSGQGTSKVDITGANGYAQFRMRTSYTPTGTADANGNTGDMAWDASYIYIKTAAGWKRSALSTW